MTPEEIKTYIEKRIAELQNLQKAHEASALDLNLSQDARGNSKQEAYAISTTLIYLRDIFNVIKLKESQTGIFT